MKKYYVATTVKQKRRHYVGRKGKLTRYVFCALKWKYRFIAKLVCKIKHWETGNIYSVAEIQL